MGRVVVSVLVDVWGLGVSAVESLRARQGEQVRVVEGLEARAVRLRELDEERAGEAREYAREWQEALRLELSERVLREAGLEVPDVPARARRKSSRSGKREQLREVGESVGE